MKIKIIKISQALVLSSCLFLPLLAQANSGKSSDNAQLTLPNGGALKVESGGSINGINVTVDYVDKSKSSDEEYDVTLNLTGPCQFSDGGTSKSHTKLKKAFNESYNVSVNSTATALCKLQVQVTKDANFNQTREFKIQQHLHWKDTAPTSKIATDGTFNLRAEGRNQNGNTSGMAVTYSTSDSNVCTVNTAGVVTNVGGGTCSISATAAGDANWTATDIASELVAGTWPVFKDKQEIIVSAGLPASIEVGKNATVNAHTKSQNLGSNTGLPLGFTVGGCALQSSNNSSATVLFDRVGTCHLNIDQAGNGKYDEALTKTLSTVVTPKEPQNFAYVKPQASGQNNCTSWANACSDIQTAIDMADAVYIAKGVYKITTPLVMKPDIRLWGGYLGNEANMSKAKPNGAVNLTILSADKDNNDTIVDGYTPNAGAIKGSNTANIITANNVGKGIESAIYLSDLVLTGATSSAITVTGSNMTISNTLLVGNKASNGGAINSNNSIVTIDASAFVGNQATSKGGAIVTANAANDVVIRAALFANNVAASEGGAISAPQGKLAITNGTFSGNSLTSTSGAGGAIHLAGNTNGASIQYATFINNAAGTQANANGNGGGIYAANGANNVVLSNSLLMGNKASKGPNIYGADKLTTTERNIVGFNKQSGMATASGATFNFPTSGSQSFTAVDESIEDIVEPVLRNNGGLLASHAITIDGLAKNYIPATASSCGPKGGEFDVITDGRMQARPAAKGTSCDVGSYEVKEGFCDSKQPANILAKSLFPDSVEECDNQLFAELGALNKPLLVSLLLLGLYRIRRIKLAA